MSAENQKDMNRREKKKKKQDFQYMHIGTTLFSRQPSIKIRALVKFWMILRGEFNAHAPMITFYGAARHTLPEATQKSQRNISTLFISTAMPIYHGYPTGMSIMFS